MLVITTVFTTNRQTTILVRIYAWHLHHVDWHERWNQRDVECDNQWGPCEMDWQHDRVQPAVGDWQSAVDSQPASTHLTDRVQHSTCRYHCTPSPSHTNRTLHIYAVTTILGSFNQPTFYELLHVTLENLWHCWSRFLWTGCHSWHQTRVSALKNWKDTH